jgi:hypothetical protein
MINKHTRGKRFRSPPQPAPVTNSQIRTEGLPPHILFEAGVLTFLKLKGIALPNKVKIMFGPNLEGLPANMLSLNISSTTRPSNNSSTLKEFGVYRD